MSTTLPGSWSSRRKVLVFLLAAVSVLAGLLLILTADGTLYERWKAVMLLKNLQKSWVLDGSPRPFPDPQKYGYSNSGTAYVYAASQPIGGRTYGGLFAYRPYGGASVFVITTNGVPLLIRENGTSRLVWVHKTRGAAW